MDKNQNPDRNGLAALPYCVARITSGVHGNQSVKSHGTGFFYNFLTPTGEIPCIVSNKHVLSNRPWIDIEFAAADANGRRVLGPSIPVRIMANQLPVIDHPDKNVDLAIMPVGPILQELKQSDKEVFIVCLSKQLIIDPARAARLTAATDVLMVGFPNGLMDATNNLPVVRRGALSTPYHADYEGRPNFVVDIAAFGGSSGSPVFAFYNGIEADGTNMHIGGQSFYLIGVLHSGPVLNAEGKIEQRPVPTDSVAITKQMIHLGFCAKARLMDDFLGPLHAACSQ